MDREEIDKIKNAVIKIHNGNYVAGLNILSKLVGWGDYTGYPRIIQHEDLVDFMNRCPWCGITDEYHKLDCPVVLKK